MLHNAIEVQNLTHHYGQVQALDQVSFTVEAGEVFGFLGPNGAGKTTTLRILTGQLRPSSGHARVAGCDVISEHDLLKPRIGVVFEHQNLYERLSARENLAFSAGLYGAPRKNIDEVLGLVGLKERAGDPLKTYSNGMKQRLLIGRALLHKPQVLFLDKPHARPESEHQPRSPLPGGRPRPAGCHHLPDHPLHGRSRAAVPPGGYPGPRPYRRSGPARAPKAAYPWVGNPRSKTSSST